MNAELEPSTKLMKDVFSHSGCPLEQVVLSALFDQFGYNVDLAEWKCQTTCTLPFVTVRICPEFHLAFALSCSLSLSLSY